MKSSSRRFHVCPVRSVLIVLIAFSTLALIGCFGGGGGGMTGPDSADRNQVAVRVQGLLNVLASGDIAALKGFLPSPLGEDIPESGRFRPLFVQSFGNDLIDPSDNATFTFFFDPNEITFPSPEVALAPLWTWLSNGEKLGIEIRLHKIYSEWYVDIIRLMTLDLFQAAMTGGAVPSSALWPLARGNRWQFVEIQAPPTASIRAKIAPGVNAMLLNATRACLRTLETNDDPVPGEAGRQAYRIQMSVHESNLATSQLDLPLDPGTLEFGRFSNGISAIEWGFIPVPSGAVPGAELWEILDPAHQGSMGGVRAVWPVSARRRHLVQRRSSLAADRRAHPAGSRGDAEHHPEHPWQREPVGRGADRGHGTGAGDPPLAHGTGTSIRYLPDLERVGGNDVDLAVFPPRHGADRIRGV